MHGLASRINEKSDRYKMKYENIYCVKVTKQSITRPCPETGNPVLHYYRTQFHIHMENSLITYLL